PRPERAARPRAGRSLKLARPPGPAPAGSVDAAHGGAGVALWVHAARSDAAAVRSRRLRSRPVRAVVITTTEPMITAEAIRTRTVSGSPANAHPNSTATTGLTYAYVETRAGVDTLSRKTYAEYPISEPKTIR